MSYSPWPKEPPVQPPNDELRRREEYEWDREPDLQEDARG